MLIETLALMLVTAAPDKPPKALVDPASISFAAAPAYLPNQRAVDNWRTQSALALEMDPLAAARRALALENGDPARCVKLNNYWCIKRAGWNGEIAADADGHVAFASAAEGAAVAALLLRRYYVDYNRRNARAIVERWAPAQCLLRPPGGGLSQMPSQHIAPTQLAPKGLQNTLRARWLAAHGQMGLAPMREQNELRAEWLAAHGHPGFVKESGASKSGKKDNDRRARSKVLDMMETPTIMEGVAETSRKNRAADQKATRNMAKKKEPALSLEDDLADLAPSTTRSTAASTASTTVSLPPLDSFDCSGEMARIANYAEHLIAGVVASPYDDLLLFTPEGQPTERLAQVMANMAAVEIGPAKPRRTLVEGAVADLRKQLKAGADLTPPATTQDAETQDAATPPPAR